MIPRLALAVALIALSPSPLSAQSPDPSFVAADIHPSPHRTYPFFFAVLLNQNRYIVRDATMVDLIASAYGLDRENIQAGPSWLEMDRFDIVASVPPGASTDTIKLMLRTLLTERFALATHPGTKPMPAFVLSASPGKPKLTSSDAPGEPGCDDKSAPHTEPTSYIHVACHNMTMDRFATQLHSMAGGYLDKPVVNSTTLEGAWNFDIQWTSRGDLEKAGADGISIFDAVQKQLGLKLALQTAPRAVVLVDTVNETPTPNRLDLATILPPPPPPQFEVATIKPTKPGTHGNGRISGGVVSFTSISLKDMIDLAWDLSESDPQVIANPPSWLSEDRYDLSAKVAEDATGRSASFTADLPMDIYEVEKMLRALLVERFAIQAHMEDRPIDAYTLLAVNPKLRPADPSSRTGCKEEPGPDGKDPRLANPVLNRLLTCRHMSMQQICAELQNVANGYIFAPVADATGLKGAYDFTLSFSSAGRLLPDSAQPASTDPSGALSLFDAVSRQLGLKLEKQKRPLPVLVLDHIERKPTEN